MGGASMTRDDSLKEPVSIDRLCESVGSETGVSSWIEVSQSMIDSFADVTDDHNFIHVDREAAARTPFGGTIAHGFLTLSLLSSMAFRTLPPLAGSLMSINHGFDQVRFLTPVPAGGRVRGRFTLADVRVRPSGYVQITYDVVVEVEGFVKPALTARWLTIAVVKPQEEEAGS